MSDEGYEIDAAPGDKVHLLASKRDLDMLQILARQAAASIENARRCLRLSGMSSEKLIPGRMRRM